MLVTVIVLWRSDEKLVFRRQAKNQRKMSVSADEGDQRISPARKTQ